MENIIYKHLLEHPDTFFFYSGQDNEIGIFEYSIISRSDFEDILNQQIAMNISFYFEDGKINLLIPNGAYSLVEPEFDANCDTSMPSAAHPMRLMSFSEIIRSEVAIDSVRELSETLAVFRTLEKDINGYVARRGKRVRDRVFDEREIVGVITRWGEGIVAAEEYLPYKEYEIRVK